MEPEQAGWARAWPDLAVENDWKMLVGGQLVDADGGATLEVVDPASGRVVAKIPSGSVDDVDLAVHAAEAAFPSWSRTSAADRAATIIVRGAHGVTMIDPAASDKPEGEAFELGTLNLEL